MSTDTAAEVLTPAGEANVQAAPAIEHVLSVAGDASTGQWAGSWLGRNGLPDPKAELWRYTPLDRIANALEAVSAAGDRQHPDSGAAGGIDTRAGRHGRFRVVFVDGLHSPELSDHPGDGDPVPPGVTVGVDPERTRLQDPDAQQARPDDGFVVLNAAGGGDSAVVHVPSGVAVGCPIQVVHLRTGAIDGTGSSLSQPHTVIDIAPGASAQVIESHVSGGAGVTNAVTSIRVGTGGHLTHVRTQDDDATAVHVAETTVDLAQGAHFESASLCTGADVARSGLTVGLNGEYASAHLSGLSILGGTQRHDTVLSIDHAAPNCRSVQDFRSVVDDRARSSFCGHVSVAHGAAGTDAAQSNRNLLLSRTAQADTRPWLEILADDVKCNHGATVGRLDDEALFYLRSRGVPAARARAMLVAAFAAEITDRLEPESLRHALDEAIARLDPDIDRTVAEDPVSGDPVGEAR